MTLKEYILMTQQDYDVYDTEYDACITVCSWNTVNDTYDEFIDVLCSKVPVKAVGEKYSLIVPWSELIRLNLEVLKKFTEKYWRSNCQYSDDIDEFKYQWIRELNAYVAGEVPDSMYTDLVALVRNLVPVRNIDKETTYF